jgi:branched-chain amino acid transport system substrate-binding protein
MKKYYPDGSLIDNSNVYGYTVATTLHQVLKQAGDNLTRENVMRQAASMKGFKIDTLLPGVTISTGSQDYAPIQSVQLMRFNGKQWERFGQIIDSSL